MSYVVLARKWRPMRFEDLVGQDHVARTLGNAIDAGRVAHAFLFTGVRGVGKTTSARILAKALNCMREPGTVAPGSPDPGPTVTPCLKCPACLEITEGTDLDVREIDGASYNGVDEVRKLQDSLPYRPSRDRYKVVIVDEVHMLSQAAWNAFLKTLEEPPPHVKFIFATTEVHKVPITILSRVQRFDFKMIPTRLIVERLRWVLEQERSSADDVALGILARQAAGSMRDAMSLLDQVIAFAGDKLNGDDVARVLGVASRKALFDLGRAVVGGEPEQCLRIVGSLADQGFDIAHVTKDVLQLLRDLVVAKVVKSPDELLDLADEEKEDVRQMIASASESDLLRLHQAFSKGYDDVVRGVDPRAGLEMLLVRLALRPPLLPVDELLHRIGHLEKRLVQGGAAPGGAAPGGAAPGTRPRETGGGAPPGRVPPAGAPLQRPRGRSMRQASSASPRPAPADDDAPGAEIPPSPAEHLPAPSPTPPKSNHEGEDDPYQATDEEQSLVDFAMEVVELVRKGDSELAAYLEQTVVLGRTETTLNLGIEKGNMFQAHLTSEHAKLSYGLAIREALGPDAKLHVEVDCKEAVPTRTLSAFRARRKRLAHARAVEEVKRHPRVREAIEIFNAQIKNVSLPDFP